MPEYNPGAGGLRGLLLKPPIRRSRFAEASPLGFGAGVRRPGEEAAVDDGGGDATPSGAGLRGIRVISPSPTARTPGGGRPDNIGPEGGFSKQPIGPKIGYDDGTDAFADVTEALAKAVIPFPFSLVTHMQQPMAKSKLGMDPTFQMPVNLQDMRPSEIDHNLDVDGFLTDDTDQNFRRAVDEMAMIDAARAAQHPDGPSATTSPTGTSHSGFGLSAAVNSSDSMGSGKSPGFSSLAGAGYRGDTSAAPDAAPGGDVSAADPSMGYGGSEGRGGTAAAAASSAPSAPTAPTSTNIGGVGPMGGSAPNPGGPGGGGGGCYFTTAVVEQRGDEPDDGPTLTALRHFRDTYMMRTPLRRVMIRFYYWFAPRVVRDVPANDRAWEFMGRYVDRATRMTREGRPAAAFLAYFLGATRLNVRWASLRLQRAFA